VFVLADLLFLSAGTKADWRFVDATYLFVLQVRDLTPNVGLFWYLMAEIFSEFRSFFTYCLQLLCFSYTIPMAFKMKCVCSIRLLDCVPSRH